MNEASALQRVAAVADESQDLLDGFGADLVQLEEDAVPGQVVPGIDQYPEERKHILDVGRFGQLQAAPFFKIDVAAGQLHFQLVGVITGTEQNGNLRQGDAVPGQTASMVSTTKRASAASLRAAYMTGRSPPLAEVNRVLVNFSSAQAMMELVRLRIGWVER